VQQLTIKKNKMKTSESIIATKEHLNKSARAINEATNDMQGTPYWNSLKRYIKIYFKQNDIFEISIPNFENLTGFNRENSKKMLIEINKDLFNKN
jgi:hypothetical protein